MLKCNNVYTLSTLSATHLNVTMCYHGPDVFLNVLCVISFGHRFFLTYRQCSLLIISCSYLLWYFDVTCHTTWCLTAVRLEDDKSTKLHQMHEPGDRVRSNKPLHNKKTALNKIG